MRVTISIVVSILALWSSNSIASEVEAAVSDLNEAADNLQSTVRANDLRGAVGYVGTLSETDGYRRLSKYCATYIRAVLYFKWGLLKSGVAVGHYNADSVYEMIQEFDSSFPEDTRHAFNNPIKSRSSKLNRYAQDLAEDIEEAVNLKLQYATDRSLSDKEMKEAFIQLYNFIGSVTKTAEPLTSDFSRIKSVLKFVNKAAKRMGIYDASDMGAGRGSVPARAVSGFNLAQKYDNSISVY